MPKSRRNKLVALTKTDKKVGRRKEELVDNLRKSLEEYTAVYVFTFENMRSTQFKSVRARWSGSRFYLGKNKVMQIALGRSSQDEAAHDLYKLSRQLVGNSGLFLTNSPADEVATFFQNYSESDYARGGLVATQTVELPAGPLPNFGHSMEPHLRKLGMPTRLNKGVIELDRHFTVCKEGATLTPEQAKILKLLEIKMSQFSMALKCIWKRTSDFAVGEGAFEMIAAEGSSGQADNNDDNDDDDNDDLSE
jgi:mRNA turnover protein 4